MNISKNLKFSFSLLCASVPLWCVFGCNRTPQPTQQDDGTRVTLYCSVDEVYAKPLIARIEKRTGLKIDAVFDTEATKTAGLASRIRAERARPRADVFWSSALLQPLSLTDAGLVQPYVSETTRDVPPDFKSQGGIWTANGMRAHVIVYNAKKITGAAPRALKDLLDPRYKGRIGISNPQFGTGSDWAAVMSLRWGTKKFLQYIADLQANGVRVLPGNGDVAHAVAAGNLVAGLCDTDDYMAEKRHYPDLRLASPGPSYLTVAGEQASETVMIPMPVAQVMGAPHPKAAAKLIDAILARDTEDQLVQLMPGVLPVRLALPSQDSDLKPYLQPAKDAVDDYDKWPKLWTDVRAPLVKQLTVK